VAEPGSGRLTDTTAPHLTRLDRHHVEGDLASMQIEPTYHAHHGPPRSDWDGLTHPMVAEEVPSATAEIALTHGLLACRSMDDETAMALALEEAALALDHDDVPVGAVALVDGRIVARRHNERERLQDPTAHAEILALRDAAGALGGWRLPLVTLVVTLEPCPMCAGALIAGRVRRLVYGAADPKAGACGSLYNLCADPRLNHELPVTAGVMAEEAAALLSTFFAGRRSTNR
jgi:tRNA(adenine34) deaminase